MKKLIQQNYHWIIALLAFLEMIVYGGLINSASVYTIPVCETLGVSRGALAMATMPYTVVCFVGTMLSGYLFQHFGYKRSAVVSLILVAGSLVLMAVTQSLGIYILSKILFGMGYGVCFTAGAVRIVKNWFFKHQGLVIGMVTMASGLGGSLMTVLQTSVMERFGWRVANLVMAGIVVAVALSYLLLRDRPEELGLRPYGYGSAMKGAKKLRDDRNWPGQAFSALVKRPYFYLMNFCVLASCACIYMTSSVTIPHFQDLGFSSGIAAGYQSVLMLTLAASKLISGGLCDKFGAKPVAIFCMACSVIGQGMLGLSADPVLCYIGIALFAVGMCMTSSLIPLLATPLFGYQGSLSANGIFLAMASVANLISAPVSNAGFDAMGSYMPVFRVAALVDVGIMGLYVLLFFLAGWEKKRFFAAQNE